MVHAFGDFSGGISLRFALLEHGQLLDFRGGPVEILALGLDIGHAISGALPLFAGSFLLERAHCGVRRRIVKCYTSMGQRARSRYEIWRGLDGGVARVVKCR